MDQRDTILNAAMKHFAARGYRRATMDEVAAEVGLGTPALYHYFQNKLDLFKAVAEREGAWILGQLEAAVEKETDPVRQLRAFCLARFRILAEKYALLQISERVHQEIAQLSQKMQLSIVQREAVLLEAILNRGIQSGAFTPVDVPMTASLVQQIFRYLDTPGSYFSGRRDLAKRVDFALDLLLHGLEKRP
jgi:AcrR family transcriptional regulator